MKFIYLSLIMLCLFSCGQKECMRKNAANAPVITLLPKDTLNNEPVLFRIAEITCSWKLEDGWFPGQDLVLNRTESKSDPMVFVFQKNGMIEYLNTDYGDCPVGAFTMQEGNWTVEEQYLTLELKGHIISDGSYWWKTKYKIKELSTEKLKLERIKVITNLKNGHYVNEIPLTNAG